MPEKTLCHLPSEIHSCRNEKDYKLQTEPNGFLIVNPSLAKSCVTLLTLMNISESQFSCLLKSKKLKDL